MKVRLPEGTRRRGRAQPPKETIHCPSCGSHRLVPELAFISGAKYLCNDCGFRGSFVVKGFGGEGETDSKGGPP